MTKKKVEVKKEGIVPAIMGSWRIFLGIGVVLSLVSGIFTFDSRYYKSAEAQQQEQRVAQTIDQVQQKMELNDLVRDEKNLFEREKALKREMERYPNDKSLKDELQEVQKDRDERRRQLYDLRTKSRK